MSTALTGLVRYLAFGHFAARTIRGAISKTLQKPPLSLPREERTADMRSISWKAGEIMVSKRMRTIDPPSRGHLEWSAWILAAYHVLRPHFENDEETVEYLGEAALRGFNTRRLRIGMWLLLRTCRGNVGQVKAALGAMLTQYGASFDWDRLEQDDEVDMQVNRCFYFDFFRAHDLPLLTTVLCKLDQLWFDRIDPQKHGFRFDHEQRETMPRSAERCVFPIVRVTIKDSK